MKSKLLVRSSIVICGKAVADVANVHTTITFEGADVGTETTSAVGTIVVQGEGAKVTITANTITNFCRGFSIDNSTETGNWTNTSNSFINRISQNT